VVNGRSTPRPAWKASSRQLAQYRRLIIEHMEKKNVRPIKTRTKGRATAKLQAASCKLQAASNL